MNPNDQIFDNPPAHDESKCFAISQYRKGSAYADVVGQIYEFPNKYKGLMANTGGRFVYYEPKTKGAGVYFGTGKIGKVDEVTLVDEDPTVQPHQRRFVAKIEDYYEFATPVPLDRKPGHAREPSVQNSVREISAELFREIVDMGGRTVFFISDAHLMQVLGEQLIASETVGILELIKNAFDAGAKDCEVAIDEVPGLNKLRDVDDPWLAGRPGPIVTVKDNGRGMDEQCIVNGWLRPATTAKTRVKERLKRERERALEEGRGDDYDGLVQALRKECSGRLPIGEKGVGRFAAQRLGRFLVMTTKTASESFEWVLEVDWNKFLSSLSEDLDLHSVPFALHMQPPTRDYGVSGSGTMLRIYGGQTGFEWGKEKLQDIAHAISLLRSPIRAPESFNPSFHSQHLDEEETLPPTETADAPFTCTAIVSENGVAELELQFTPPPGLAVPLPEQRMERSIDLRTVENSNYWMSSMTKGPRKPRCGAFYISIKAWIRRKEWIHGADWRTLTAYLDRFGGIAIYRDGLSIVSSELGSAKDWLKLSTEHIKKGSRISYYNIFGTIELDQDKTLDLIANTSREGLLDTIPLRDLATLVRAVVDQMGFQVQETRDRYEQMRKGHRIDINTVRARSKQAAEILSLLGERYDFSEDPYGLRSICTADEPSEAMDQIVEVVRDARESIEHLEAQIDGLTEAAGFGISVGVAVHEIEKVTANIHAMTTSIIKGVGPSDRSYSRLIELKRVAGSLQSEVKRLAPLRVTRMEAPIEFNMRDALLSAIGAFQLTWQDLDIEVPLPSRLTDFKVRQRFGACTQVFANLLDNATYWLKGLDPKKKSRKIIIQILPAKRCVLIADNGPGIDERMRDHLFEPMYSLKSPPSGLGLYICRHYMLDMRGDGKQTGSIREAASSERIDTMSGAQFLVAFPEQEGLV
jgi:signal transduction histidine kinase